MRQQTEGRPNVGRRIVLWLSGLVIVLALLAGALLDLWLVRHETFDLQTQPESVKYEDEAVHYAGIVRTRSRLLGRHHEYLLYAGRDAGMSYGHYVTVGFTGSGRPILTVVRWEPGGVRARFASGHEIFVPARYFTHGR
ncbi:hypothetical protein GCM10023085_79980 [Actinomadura viridis]|uniref:Uncharacterized protein n=1 Tax=Actinomadura viridis TaxID=58110 RepID=A0A931GJX4_9ACTN|nr:hypothetical protein [Actinomadura viridis]MBG6090213.1 hypothetical protein [Actinomadura viridis]